MNRTSPTRPQRQFELFGFGACFGGMAGAVIGVVIAMTTGFDLIDAVVGAALGGIFGGAASMCIVGAFGGRKLPRIDRMHSASFSGAFGMIVGGMAGIGILYLVALITGYDPGHFDRAATDLLIILVIASAFGTVVTWLVARNVTDEKKLQWLVLAMFLGSIAILLFITPSALAFGIGGAVAGYVSQRMLVVRNAPLERTANRDGEQS